MRHLLPNRTAKTGQALVMFAIMLPALLALMGLGVDVANMYAERRKAQSTADLAALAGAMDVPGDASTARTKARVSATANGYTNGTNSATVTVTTPYLSDSSKVEVVIVKAAENYFLPIVGIPTFTVQGRAVAHHQTANNYAFFAERHITNCGSPSTGLLTIDWSGSNNDVTGNIHSNGGLKMGGSTNGVDGRVTHVCDDDEPDPGDNQLEINGGNSIGDGPDEVGTRGWPVTYTMSQFPCNWARNGAYTGLATAASSGTFNLNDSGSWWLNGSSGSSIVGGKARLKPGVYCANGDLELSTSDVAVAGGAGITFVATGQIRLNGGQHSLTPHTLSVLAYSARTTDMAIMSSGSNHEYGGLFYAPGGRIELSGSNMTIAGSFVAKTITVNGSNNSITGIAFGAEKLQLLE